MSTLNESLPINKVKPVKYQDGFEDGELSCIGTVKMMSEIIICLIILAFIFDL